MLQDLAYEALTTFMSRIKLITDNIAYQWRWVYTVGPAITSENKHQDITGGYNFIYNL
jgi:hypothetical protein